MCENLRLYHTISSTIVRYLLFLFLLPGCSGCQQRQFQTSEENPTTQADSENSTDKSSSDESTSSSSSQKQSPENQIRRGSTDLLPPTETFQSSPSSNNSGDKSSRNGKPENPDAAISRANDLRRKADQAIKVSDFGAAFQFSSDAWEITQAFPQDMRLKKIADELIEELDDLAKKANSQKSTRAKDSNTTLIEK